MATAKFTPTPNTTAQERLSDAQDVLQALRAVEILTGTDGTPNRDDLLCLFRVLRETLEGKLNALGLALGA